MYFIRGYSGQNRLIEASSFHRGGGDSPKRNFIEASSFHRGGGDSLKRNSIEASSFHRDGGDSPKRNSIEAVAIPRYKMAVRTRLYASIELWHLAIKRKGTMQMSRICN